MTQNNRERVVVVGAGHGGGLTVAFLRQFGYAGEITLIGEETVLPYQRPPLSKAWLKGEVSQESLALRPPAFYVDQNIDLHLGVRAERIDVQARHVVLASGQEIPYDHLVLATGAHARTLPIPGVQLSNVMTLRTLVDAEHIRSALGPGKKLIIIGGGYVGLECAATARALGVEVTVLARAPRLLERVASEPVSAFLQRFHESKGVTFRLNAVIEAILGDTRAECVLLTDGTQLSCDAVLVGVGAIPTASMAQAIGLRCDDGIVVDADCRTSDPHIFAIGDVAKRPHPLYGRELRLESVPSCMEQAKRVAACITGREPAAAEVPWFWSDQYDLKLQIAGLPFEADETVVRGNPDEAKFAVFHLRAGHIVTVEAINAPPEFFAGKKLIGSGKTVAGDKLKDSTVPLTDLAA
ncbi:MAG: FAD-dependent oxidoreductase [Proteobacteria bacterium]|nr:FAD-dependent oxidoreductase [Pseudomonadota bacterium]